MANWPDIQESVRNCRTCQRFEDAVFSAFQGTWPTQHLLNVEQPSADHFYWPDLDVDLGLETIEHPERFPLKSKAIHSVKNE